jgi:hypothetical protein
MVILSLLVTLAITALASLWARRLARQRGRHVRRWIWAAAAIPPLVLILWVLPPCAPASRA